ncbi:RsmB/NOP family class I SAM-dependent RNA methyltransferase [Ruegeria sp. SCSIO 43209]|uniref:RsmB/NOP family class I SAM-dependent RNA methyltransferase n=1 Tax=Ruegeria sp. SCSIO 43209 TaxID=2793010 RepID=UPI001CAA1055|nr:RsmB/NOP family class I SAM-dependent RNA methyltransferase [Ruegeria sp. SCSIO 43209]UAB88540.1 RsmB/NOP family class I SAM-dependent RNA methyltransferase [Ruegeria sp. SCSIO 43209]
MSNSATAARRSAIYLLDQILGEGRLLPECLAAGALDRLVPEDRARAQRLTIETLRGLERADRLLADHLRQTPALTVHNALRLGTVELCQGEAAHGVVNSMVEIVGRSRKHGRLKGLVNAVLRKIAADGPDAWPKMRVPRLPDWLRDPLIMAWGDDAVKGMEQAHFNGAPLDVTLKPGVEAPGGEALPTGSVRLQDAGQVSALPGYKRGNWWVQDAAAALPVRVLAPKAGEKVLDLCAAPGGKTLQLAVVGAEVTALDISETRLERVRENLKRTGLKAKVIAGDALDHQGQYDAILLDAPCSATGTIRRHPDLPFAKDGSEFGGLIELQARMLAHAWTLLKPGGRLVYCTCSLLPDEGEVQIEEALDQYPDMQIDRAALEIAGVEPDWITEEGGLRVRPDFWADKGGIDGFYIACLNKSA